MSEGFDPYYKWLGIPAKDQPPHHYRLLGVEPLEPDPEVIGFAADQRMALVRSLQTGRHSGLSQRILNELAAARICLLNPASKAAYDQWLGEQLGRPAGGPPTLAGAVDRGPPPPAAPPVAATGPDAASPAAAAEPPPLSMPSLEVGVADRIVGRRRPSAGGRRPLPVRAIGLTVAFVVTGGLLWTAIANRRPDTGPATTTSTAVPADHQADVGERHAQSGSVTAKSAGTSGYKGPGSAPPGEGRRVPLAFHPPLGLVPQEKETERLGAASKSRLDREPAEGPSPSEPPSMASPEIPSSDSPSYGETKPTETVHVKQPEPDEASQVKAQARFEEAYRTELRVARDDASRKDLMAKLLQRAASTADPAERLVLLKNACELALKIADPNDIRRCVNQVDQDFQINARELKARLLWSAYRSEKGVPYRREIAAQSESLLERALEAEDFRAADSALRCVKTAAQAAKDFARVRELEQIEELIKRRLNGRAQP